jgi:hypothetical protein
MLVDALTGASADAGSIPAASIEGLIKPFPRDRQRDFLQTASRGGEPLEVVGATRRGRL